MQGLQVEAARRLTMATLELQQLTDDMSSRQESIKARMLFIEEERAELTRLQKATEEHERNQSAIANALDALNAKNAKLLVQLKSKREACANKSKQLEGVAAKHAALARAMDATSMSLHTLSAAKEAEEIRCEDVGHRVTEADEAQRSLTRAVMEASHNLSRVQLHCDKAATESRFIETTLAPPPMDSD